MSAPGVAEAPADAQPIAKQPVIAGFHCHTIIKTIQQITSRIKETKEDE